MTNTSDKIKDEFIASSNEVFADVFYPNGCWFLYVLLLENDYYYVGMTLNPYLRITSHIEGNGANFTKKNKPIKICELYCLDISDRKICYKKETEKTKQYRLLYGSNKVVGGKHLRLGKEVVPNAT
jgi:predicted GIY-YIG superfamily endonuclease